MADFKAYCKRNNLPDGEKRVTDDPIEAAYFGVHVWKQAVEKAGKTDVDAVRKAVYGQSSLRRAAKSRWMRATIIRTNRSDRRNSQGRPIQGGLALKGIGQAGTWAVHGLTRVVTGSVIRARIRKSKG